MSWKEGFEAGASERSENDAEAGLAVSSAGADDGFESEFEVASGGALGGAE